MDIEKVKERLFFSEDAFPKTAFNLIFEIKNNKIYYIKEKKSLKKLIIHIREGKSYWIRLFFFWLNREGIIYYYISCMLGQPDLYFEKNFNKFLDGVFKLGYDENIHKSLNMVLSYSFPWHKCYGISISKKYTDWYKVNEAWKNFLIENDLYYY